MPRERTAYREQLEALNTHFGKQFVSQKEVAEYLGRSVRWVHDRLHITANGITLPVLANRLLDLCGE